MFFYQSGDALDNFYFGLKGTSAFVIPQENYRIFCVIDPEKSLLPTNSRKKQLVQYFGIEDIVTNMIAIVYDEKN